MRALILAGGKGSRLRPLTDTRPKPMVPFMGAPLAAGLLRRLAGAGCERVTLLAGADAAPFAGLRVLGASLGIEVAAQTEESPLDTAGAVRRAVAGTAEPVLVCNGDILTDLDYRGLADAHRESGAVATVALTRVDDPSSFGVVVADRDGRVSAFVEKPAPGTAPADTVNAGTYVLDPEAFTGHDGDGPLSFEREVFPSLLQGGRGVHGLVSDAYWGDLGTPARYREGHAAVLGGRCAWPRADGISALPRGIAVHDRARVAPGAVIEPPTLVAAGAVVEEGVRLRDAVVLEGARVGARAEISEAVLGEGASVGPDARLRGDTVLGDGASVAAGVRAPAGLRLAAGEHLASESAPGARDYRM